MAHRVCGGHCPAEYINEFSTQKCRICNKEFHLPCYDVILAQTKLFVTDNIVFICDACLDDPDHGSPDRKRKSANGSIMKHSILTPRSNGNIGLASQQHTPNTNNNGKVSTSSTNDKLITMMTDMKMIIDEQSNKMNEIVQHVVEAKNGIFESHQKQEDMYNIVHSRMMLRDQQDMRDLAKQMFRPPQKQSQINMSKTPSGERTTEFGAQRTY